MGKDVCPELTAIGASQSAEYMLESILQPNAVIVKGYTDSTVVFKSGKRSLSGRILRWEPSKDRPKLVHLLVAKGGGYVPQVVDLSKVRTIGSTGVSYTTDSGNAFIYGELIKGSKKKGVTLRVLADGKWSEFSLPSKRIRRVNLPRSPMPDNFGDLMTAQEVYDLVAYLLAQKGKKK
jgi:hypothetical protein